MVNELPQQVRWQLELLLYDAEELETVERALAAAASLAESAQGFSSTAAELPAALGAEMAARIHEARPRSRTSTRRSRVRNTWRNRSPTWRIASARRARSGRRCSPSCAPTTASEDGGRPFDVREYEAAAARIGEASLGVRALVEELNRLDASGLARS